MLKIYHNPRCTKSREGLAILEESGKEFDIVNFQGREMFNHIW